MGLLSPPALSEFWEQLLSMSLVRARFQLWASGTQEHAVQVQTSTAARPQEQDAWSRAFATARPRETELCPRPGVPVLSCPKDTQHTWGPHPHSLHEHQAGSEAGQPVQTECHLGDLYGKRARQVEDTWSRISRSGQERLSSPALDVRLAAG